MGGRRVGGRATPSEGSEGNDKVAASAAGTQCPACDLLSWTQRSAALCVARAQQYCVGAGLYDFLVQRGHLVGQDWPSVAVGDVARGVLAPAATLRRAVDGLDQRV